MARPGLQASACPHSFRNGRRVGCGRVALLCAPGASAHAHRERQARANALQAKTSQGADADATRLRALAAYKDFLALWKDSDPDIPILKEAKAEYAKLQ
jgi:hypothetical protein